MIEVLQFGLGTNRGGIETYLEKIWRNIDHGQFHFNFIDMTGEGKRPCFYEELLASGCSFFKVTPRNVSVKKNREDIKKLFAENRFDIFHFNVNTLSYLLPVEEALANGCKVLIHSRSSKAPNTKSLTMMFHCINKLRLKQMDVTRIAVSSLAGKWLFGEDSFHVYNNGVITEDFIYSDENRKKVRTLLNCDDRTVIANVGAFVPAKNHQFMVDVFEEYLKINSNSVLWFVGDGPLRNEIENKVKMRNLQGKVLFLGVRSDMQELYSGMDLFWFPSLYEGYGSVLLEAQCEGLPCLLSDCIPQDARILDNTASYSLKESKVNWASKIQELLKEQRKDRPNCYKEMEAKGASVRDEVRRLEKLYNHMMK